MVFCKPWQDPPFPITPSFTTAWTPKMASPHPQEPRWLGQEDLSPVRGSTPSLHSSHISVETSLPASLSPIPVKLPSPGLGHTSSPLPAHCPSTHSTECTGPQPPGPPLLPTHRPLCPLSPTPGMSPLTSSPLPGSLLPLAPTPVRKNPPFLGALRIPHVLCGSYPQHSSLAPTLFLVSEHLSGLSVPWDQSQVFIIPFSLTSGSRQPVVTLGLWLKKPKQTKKTKPNCGTPIQWNTTQPEKEVNGGHTQRGRTSRK
jgi:hypothetical protein